MRRQPLLRNLATAPAGKKSAKRFFKLYHYQAAEQLKVTRRYAELILLSRNLEGSSRLNKEKASRIASALVTNYPTHGFVIDRQQLRELGIPCRSIEEHPLWPRMLELYRTFIGSGGGELLRVIGGAGDPP